MAPPSSCRLEQDLRAAFQMLDRESQGQLTALEASGLGFWASFGIMEKRMKTTIRVSAYRVVRFEG